MLVPHWGLKSTVFCHNILLFVHNAFMWTKSQKAHRTNRPSPLPTTSPASQVPSLEKQGFADLCLFIQAPLCTCKP
jgi:hypothetical protein